MLRPQDRPARWEPEIVFDSEASRDRDTWTNRSAKMDLRLCAAARIPLIADDLRITEPGRARMLTAIGETTATDLLGSLAKRFGLGPAVSWQETDEPEGRNDRRAAAYRADVPGDAGRPAIRAGLWLMLPAGFASEVGALMDMRVDFDAIRPGSEPPTPADLRVTYRELIHFFELAWQVTTSTLLLAVAEQPHQIPPAGAPRLELYVQNERPPASGDSRVCRTLDMVDLAELGRPRTEIRDVAVAVTAPLCLPKPQISDLVAQALQRIGEDFGFASAY
jgi:hypothetical protein